MESDSSKPVPTPTGGLLAPSNDRRICILVAGMHRSGTSATAGLLNALGAAAGNALVPANRWNTRGHFELQSAVDINDRCLSALGLSWQSVQPLPHGWENGHAAKEAIASMTALLRTQFSDTPLCMIKDPRMCRLLPLWLHALAAEQVDARVLIAVRAPGEVAASLDVRDRISSAHAYALWLLHMLDVEAASRSTIRAAIDYDRLLGDWRSEMVRIAQQLGLGWKDIEEDHVKRIDHFLSPSLRHHDERAQPEIHAGNFPTLSRAIEAFRAMAQGPASNHLIFDELRQQVEEGIALWQRGAPEMPSARQAPAWHDLLNVFELPLRTPRQEVLALYWRNAGEDYAQSRSVSCPYVSKPGNNVSTALRLPCKAMPRFLRIDPAMAPGMYRISAVSIAGVHLENIRLGRVNGTPLAARKDELARLYADHDDPWIELDLDGSSCDPEIDGIEIALDFQRVGIAEALERRLNSIESHLLSPAPMVR